MKPQAQWRQSLRQIIEGLKSAQSGNEVTIDLGFRLGKVTNFTWDLKEALQRLFMYEFVPNRLRSYDHDKVGIPVTDPLGTPNFNHPVSEFIWWASHIVQAYPRAEEYFRSREMKRLIDLWHDYWRSLP